VSRAGGFGLLLLKLTHPASPSVARIKRVKLRMIGPHRMGRRRIVSARRFGITPGPENGSACRAIGPAISPRRGRKSAKCCGTRPREHARLCTIGRVGIGAMVYRMLALLVVTALPGCAANSFGAPQLRDNAEAPAWRRPGPTQITPLQRLPAPAYSARA
jgi:uncharacterized protein YjeT (DUF2065 family)